MNIANKVLFTKVFWVLFCGVILFGYIYTFNLTILGFPSEIHSTRVTATIIILLGLVKYVTRNGNKQMVGAPKRSLRKQIVFHIVAFFYMIFLAVINGQWDGENMVTILPNFFYVTILPVFALFYLFDDLEEFMASIMVATVIQTFFIWICTTNPQTGLTVDILFNASEYTKEGRLVGYAGGLGCITAPGLLRYTTGFVASIYFLFKTKKTVFFILYLFFVFTGTMVARTGLFIGLVGLLIVFAFFFSKNKFRTILTSALVVLLVLFFVTLINQRSSNKDFFDERFQRMISLYEESQEKEVEEVSFFDNYIHSSSTYLPEISAETLIGTGVISGTSGSGIKVNVDGGFLRLYVGYGLILCVFFYLFFYSNLTRLALRAPDRINRYLLVTMTFFIFMGELKEWFIYSSCYFCFFYVAALLVYREDRSFSHKISQS